MRQFFLVLTIIILGLVPFRATAATGEESPSATVTTSCDSLTAASIDSMTFKFQIAYTAKNGAQMTEVIYDFGDDIIGSGGAFIAHTYATPGHYQVTATVKFTAPEGSGELTSQCRLAVAAGEAVYGQGITGFEYSRTYAQTVCDDYTPIRGSIENAIKAGRIIERDGLLYAAHAGISWGPCPTLDSVDVYITSCEQGMGDVKLSYGWRMENGWDVDANGTQIIYLIHSSTDHPCDAGNDNIQVLLNDSPMNDWYTACMNGPVLFVLGDELVRCDANPVVFDHRSKQP